MKSSIRISRGGRSISFSGRAARKAFEGMTGTKLPPSEAVPHKMDPNRFTVGQRVKYVNHVMKYEIGLLEVTAVDGDGITAKKFFGGQEYRFGHDGIAAHSPNLSIVPA